jgi:uncharacterized protein
MDISPLVPKERKLVERYGEGGFRIDGEDYRGSVLLLADRIIPWNATGLDDVTAESLAPLFEAADNLEILLLGCGAKGALAPRALRQAVRAKGPVLDAMDSGAACRTFNVLVAEERRVAAALIAFD